jgi:hypothetical protein
MRYRKFGRTGLFVSELLTPEVRAARTLVETAAIT